MFVEQNIQRHTDQSGVLYLEEKLPENCPIQFYKQGYATKLYTHEKNTPTIVILKKLHVDLDEVEVADVATEVADVARQLNHVLLK